MNDRANPRLVRRCSIWASASAVFAVVVGLSVLAGWKLHIANLYTWGVFPVRMVPNTAVGFILQGVSLWLLRRRDDHSFALARARTLTSRISAATAALLGLFSLGEHVLGWDFGIDQWLLVLPAADRIAGLRPGLMPSITASSFIVLGIALLILDWKTRRDDWPAQFLGLGILTGAAFGLLALLLEPAGSYTRMALPTVATFFVLASGLLCSRAAWAFGGLLVSDSQGVKFLRKVLPGGLLVFSVIGWLMSKPLLTGARLTWVEVSVLAIFCGATFAAFIAWVAFMFDRGDSERKKLEDALHIDKGRMDQLLDRIEEPQAEVKLRRKVKAGFAFAIVLTSLLGFLSWRMAEQAADNADWISHTHEVSTALEATLLHQVDVETGGRGFSLTGNKPFLEPYETGRSAVVEDLRTLRLLLAGSAEQTQRLNVLANQTNATIEAARELVALPRNVESVPTETQLERGKQLMDAVRATVGEMEAAQSLLLKQRIQHSRSTQYFNFSVIALGAVVGIFFLSVAGATVSREIGISARSRAQVNVLNGDLERRVADRTAALAESEGRLAGVIQSATDSIISVDEEHRIVLFNGTAETTFRCPAAEAMGQPITRFIPQRFHSAHTGHIRTFGDTGVTSRAMGAKGELWAVRADGEEFQIEASISQVARGGVKLFTVILRDVSERVLAAQARERLAAIVDSSDDAIVSNKLDSTITAWNHGAEKIFGYTSSEAMGKSVRMLVPPERGHEETDILARIGRGLSVEHFETIRVRKDGRKINVALTISPIRDNSGVVIGASKIARDITERKRVEEALDEQSKILDLAQVLVRDLGGRIVLWNTGAENLYGFTREEALGRIAHELLHTQFPEPPHLIEEQLRRTGAWQGELIHHKRDGERIVVASLWRLHRDEEGNPARILETNTDITARKQAEEKLVMQAEELARSREALEVKTVMLKLVLDNMGEGLVAADLDGHFFIWNDAARNLMGRGAEDLPIGEWTRHSNVLLPDGITPYPPDRLPLVRALRGESG